MQSLTHLFKLLSDETRLRILMLLFEGELCVCELSGILEVPQPKVSKSLSKLKDLGLVLDERKDKFVFYRLNPNQPLIKELLTLIQSNQPLYPLLTTDRKRLNQKHVFLNQCSVEQLADID